jgi:hypothetical protein
MIARQMSSAWSHKALRWQLAILCVASIVALDVIVNGGAWLAALAATLNALLWKVGPI